MTRLLPASLTGGSLPAHTCEQKSFLHPSQTIICLELACVTPVVHRRTAAHERGTTILFMVPTCQCWLDNFGLLGRNGDKP